MSAESNAPEDRGLPSLRGAKRRTLMRRARREVRTIPEGKLGSRVRGLGALAGCVLGFAYLAMGPGFDDIPEVVVVVAVGNLLGGIVGGVARWRIISPHVQRRFREFEREEVQRTERG